MIKRMLKSLDCPVDRIDFETIKAIGSGGQYLTHPSTFKHSRTEFYVPDLLQRDNYTTWLNMGRKGLLEVAEKKVIERLEKWEKPDIDPEIERNLNPI